MISIRNAAGFNVESVLIVKAGERIVAVAVSVNENVAAVFRQFPGIALAVVTGNGIDNGFIALAAANGIAVAADNQNIAAVAAVKRSTVSSSAPPLIVTKLAYWA